jgi:hypothetical protein
MVGTPLSSLGIVGAAVYAIYALYATSSQDYGFRGTRLKLPISSRQAISSDERRAQVAPSMPLTVTKEESRSPVEVSVFAPPRLAARDQFYIQVFLHALEAFQAAEQTATKNEPAAELQGAMPMILPLQANDRIRITLDTDGAIVIGNAVQEFHWSERLEYVAFAVRFPKRIAPRTCRPVVRLFVNGVPTGLLRLKIEVTRETSDEKPSSVVETAHPYRKVFTSYSSQDRLEALRFIQGLKAMHADVFADVLSLRAGQNWASELEKEIRISDAFFLLWSTNAKNSEWVLREVHAALASREASGLPEIVPIILEGPPVVPPPPGLEHIHFYDPLQAIFAAEKTARAVNRDPPSTASTH